MSDERRAACEPRWYFEPWAVLFLVLISLPIGYYCLLRSPQIGRGSRLAAALLICMAVVTVGVTEHRYGWIASGVDDLLIEEHSVRAQKLEEAERFEEAAAEWMADFRVDPLNARWPLKAGHAMQLAGKHWKALALLAAASPSAQLDMGGLAGVRAASLLLEDAGRTGDALDLADRLVETGQAPPTSDEACLMMADAELARDQVGSSEFHLRRVIDRWDTDLTGRAYHLLSQIRSRQGQLSSSLAMLGQSLINAPTDAATGRRLIEAAIKQHEPAEPYRAFVVALRLDEGALAHSQAMALLDRIATRYPKLAIIDAVEYRRGTCLNWHQSAYAAAIPRYESILALTVRSECYWRAHFQIGLCRAALGQHAAAAQRFGLILKERPDSHWGMLARVRLLEMRQLGNLPRGLDRLISGGSS